MSFTVESSKWYDMQNSSEHGGAFRKYISSVKLDSNLTPLNQAMYVIKLYDDVWLVISKRLAANQMKQ